LIIIYKYYL